MNIGDLVKLNFLNDYYSIFGITKIIENEYGMSCDSKDLIRIEIEDYVLVLEIKKFKNKKFDMVKILHGDIIYWIDMVFLKR